MMSAVATQESTCEVQVQPSGRTFTVNSGETILLASIRQGIGLPYGCKDGACGSCKCKLISGTVTQGQHQSKALTPQEAAMGMVLTCCATALSPLVLESRQVTLEGALPIKRMPTRITTLQKVTPDVMLVTLQLPGNESFSYHSGQYIEFLLADGIRRSYSMANAPELSNTIELHIRHMPGGVFTDRVFGSMKEKEILRIEGPFGSFYLREDSAKPIILLASGTGFAPIKALIERLQFLRSTRPISVYWGGRRPADLYMAQWVEAQEQTMPNLNYIPVVSDASADDDWTGRTGFVHRAVMQDFPNMAGYQVYACGSPAMVDAAKADFAAQCQLPDDDFFADSFTSAADNLKAVQP